MLTLDEDLPIFAVYARGGCSELTQGEYYIFWDSKSQSLPRRGHQRSVISDYFARFSNKGKMLI